MTRKLILLLACLALLHSTYGENRDKCQTIGQPCVCSNTKLKGFCFPTLLSQEQELYCDCQSDVLSEQEMILVMAGKYKNDGNVKRSVQKFYPEMGSVFEEVLRSQKKLEEARLRKKMGALIYNKKAQEKLARDIEQAEEALRKVVAQVAEKMVLTSQKTPTLASLFFNVYYCSYYGESCRCGNTGLEGICAVDRNFRKNDFYCHCGG